MEILTITPLNKEQDILIASRLLVRLLRWQLSEFLREHQIPNRTKIFNGLKYGYFYWSNEVDYAAKNKERDENHKKFTAEVLEFTTLKDVIVHYLKHSNIDTMINIVGEKEIGFKFDLTFSVGNYNQEKIEKIEEVPDGTIVF